MYQDRGEKNKENVYYEIEQAKENVYYEREKTKKSIPRD